MAFIKRSLIALAGVAALLPSCSGQFDGSPSTTETKQTKEVGGLNLAVTLGGESFSTVDMTIHATGGQAQPDITRTINVASQHATISAFAGALLPGTYSVSMQATALVTNDGCSGSATVTVTAGTTTGVTVPIICSSNPTSTNTGRGQTSISATVTTQSTCDFLTEMVVDPLATDTGATIDASAKSSGTGDTFAWTVVPAALGTFAPATTGPGGTSTTVFTCGGGGGTGTVTVTLTKTGTSCTQTLSTGITCVTACTDGVKNGTETGVDCGGGTCPACPSGQGCTVAGDCQSGICTAGLCAASSCTDGIKNGTETGVDCGGSCATHCANGIACGVNGDCTSGFCNPTTHLCAAASCTDGSKNGTETDVDCGGGACPACGSGKTCSVNGDCSSGNCTGGVCGAVVMLAGQTDCSGATTCAAGTSSAHPPPCAQHPATGDTCLTCEASNCPHDATFQPYCQDLTVAADKTHCQAVLDCIRQTNCIATGNVSCFCGADLSVASCKSNPIGGTTGAHGACRDQIIAAFTAGATPGNIVDNIGVVTIPGGAALSLGQCDFTNCGDITGTNECVPYCK
jgi:hypothetical protein